MIALLLLGLVRIGTVYWAARYLVEFSERQALFIAFAAAIVETRYLKSQAATFFRPFHLWIQPNYPLILLDAGLLTRESELGELLKAGDAPVDGAACNALACNADSKTHLIAWPEWKEYTCRLEHALAQIDLDELGFPMALRFPARCRRGNGRMKARFGVRPCRFGFEVFMRIDDEWWERRWSDSPDAKPHFGEHTDITVDGPGDVDLTLGIIPYTEFQHFYTWNPTGWTISRKRRERNLEALGWKDETDPRFHLLSRTRFLSHRYLDISHGTIDQIL